MQEAVEWIKMEYAAREDELFSKIKGMIPLFVAFGGDWSFSLKDFLGF